MSRTASDVPDLRDFDRFADRVTALETLLMLLDERVDDERLDPVRDVADRITERLALSPVHTVVALAGATGSGKSSLFNALVGLNLSPVGVRRPTTASAKACVWHADGTGPLLDWLGISREDQIVRESPLDAETQSDLRGLVLLDLPDHDSTELVHRLEVDRLVERVDLLIWVLDPQKYADAAIHERYLRPLHRHADVTVVALNQVDLLTPREAAACLADLRRLLDAEGLAGAPVVATSVVRREGLAELRSMLVDAVAARRGAMMRINADLDGVAEGLADLAGPDARAGVDREVTRTLYVRLADAAGVTAVGDAAEAGYRDRARRLVGWPVARWFARSRRDPDAPGRRPRWRVPRPATTPADRDQLEAALRTLATSAAGHLPAPWPGQVTRAAVARLDELPRALERAVGAADLGLDRTSRWWRVGAAVQWVATTLLLAGAACLLAWTGVSVAAAADVEGAAALARRWSGLLVVPGAAVAAGLVVGLLVAAAGRTVAARGARRVRAVAEEAARAGVTSVTRERVLAPVRAELDCYLRVREALGTLSGRSGARPAATG